MTRKEILLLLAGLAAGSLLGLAYIFGSSWLANRRENTPTRGLGIGNPAPDFSLELMDGTKTSLAQYRGHPVLLNFWATWCTPCKEEMPMFEQYAERYSPDLVVLGVNYGETRDMAQAFIAENAIDFPILLDPGSSTGPAYMIRAFPTTFFIDPDGVLRSMHIGQLSEELMDQYLPTIGLAQ